MSQDPTPAARARAYARDRHRAVLITHRRDGGLQSSPIAVVPGDDLDVDAADTLWISTRAGSAKVANIEREPAVSLTLLPDEWYGAWLHVDGRAEVVRLPDALPLLEEYYRRAAGEHPDWDDYRRAMQEEERVILRVTVDRAAGPT